MATRTNTITALSNRWNEDCHTIEWTGLLNTDDGTPLEMPGSNDRSVQVRGTFGAGGSLRIEGSNDGANYATLTDPQGNALDFTTAKIEQVSELTRFIRPRITAGDGTTSLVCTMLVRRNYHAR